MVAKTVFIFDQANSSGGSLDRMIEISNSLTSFNFILATLHPISELTKKELAPHVINRRIFSYYDDSKLEKIRLKLRKKKPILGTVATVIFRIWRKVDNGLISIQLSLLNRTHKIDLVQSNSNLHYIPFNLAKTIKKPLVTFLRSQTDYSWWSYEQVNICSRFVCVSKALLDYYQKNLKAETGKFRVIYSPFDAIDKLKTYAFEGLPPDVERLINSNTPSACQVGRICEEKGQIDLIMAIAKLKSKGIILNIIFVGPIELSGESRKYYKKLSRLIEQLALSDQVCLLGHRKDVLHIMNKVDFLINPTTRFEGLGGTIIEAIQLGKYVISNDMGGPREIIKEGKTGMLFKTKNIEDLQDKIYQVVKNKLYLDVDSSERLNIIDKFSPPHIRKDIENEYLSLTQIDN